MEKIELTAFELAQRFVGMQEVKGPTANPQVLAMLRLDQDWPDDDEVPWCSAFMNYITWLVRLPRSKDLLARSWLKLGRSISLEEAQVGFDVVILKRGTKNQPGPDVLNAPGHVGFFAGLEGTFVQVLGGNQDDTVSISRYPTSRVLGVRRLL